MRVCAGLINITLHVANFLRYHYKIFYFGSIVFGGEFINHMYRVRKKGQKSKLNSKNDRKKVHARKIKGQTKPPFDNLVWHFRIIHFIFVPMFPVCFGMRLYLPYIYYLVFISYTSLNVCANAR